MTQQQQMIVDAFNSDIYVNNRMDVQHEPLYDTVTIAAAGTLSTLTSAFFTNVGPASNKTLALTNVTQSQKLPAPEAFSIFGFRLRISEDIFITDLYTLMNGFALEFYLGQKCYQRAPLWYFSPGGGITGYPALAAAAQASFYNNGVPHRESMHKLAIPLVIENQMTFMAQFVGTTQVLTAGGGGGTGATLVLLLDGLHARGVQ